MSESTEWKNTGLRESDLAHIRDAARAFPEIRQVILFGSRAKGTHKPGSDVDLALKGDALTYETVLGLTDMLNEEKPLPYFFDVVDYQRISEQALVEHINRVGVVIFESVP